MREGEMSPPGPTWCLGVSLSRAAPGALCTLHSISALPTGEHDQALSV